MISSLSEIRPKFDARRGWKPRRGASPLVIFILVLNLSTGVMLAQPSSLNFEHLAVNKGLSNNEVTAIIQDRQGFMWFGTANGLNRYDGYSVTACRTNPLDTASKNSPWIVHLYEDTHGELWISRGGELHTLDKATGTMTLRLPAALLASMCEDTSVQGSQDGMWFTTNKGIYQYDRKGGRFVAYRHIPGDSNSISTDSTISATVDTSGTLWIGTTKGLNSLDRTRRYITRYAHGPERRVYALFDDTEEPSGVLWIGASDGLYAYDKSSNSFSRYGNPFASVNLPEDNDIRTIYADNKGRLWVGMMGGIARFDRSTRRFISFQRGFLPKEWSYGWEICEDRTGTMWMITHWGPLRRYDEAKNDWTPVPIESDHEVRFHAIYLDRSGTIWLGTAGDAVLKLDRARKPFSHVSKIPGDTSSLTSATVTGICEDASGTLWVGTLRGLNKLNPTTGTFTHYLHDDRRPNSPSHDVIRSILEDQAGRLWLGTAAGLDEFDRITQRFVHRRNRPGGSLNLPRDDVTALSEGRDGTLWIGTDYGNVAEYSPASNFYRLHSPGYAKTGGIAALVRDLDVDQSGMIWAAAPPSGLNSYDRTSDTWTQYVRDPGTPDGGGITGPVGGALSLCADRRGNIWVGTSGGLFGFDRQIGRFTYFSEKDGLADTYINAILEDGKGNLWLCTTNGLSKFNPKNGSFRNYDAADGVNIGPCTLMSRHRNARGEMFFGGSNGFVRFHPDSIRDNPYVPPIVITAFKLFDKIVPLDSAIFDKRRIEMTYKENVFSFEFASLNFTSPEKNQYAYKLEGFDDNWTYCGTRRYAMYTNLDGGSYVFRVKGSNNDGVWNEEGASITIVITPPFWATWWFRGLVFVVMLVSVGGSIRYIEMRKMKGKIERLEKERAVERERARISQDMHDEVGASLTEIAILSELTMKEMGDRSAIADAHVRKIADRSREVVDSLSQIIWTINPKNDHLDDLVAYLHHYAVLFLNSTAIRCRFESPEDVPEFSLSAEARRHIFLVVKEALHNVVKHSRATESTVRCDFEEGRMVIAVEDNGTGFPVDEGSRFGNGVLGMRKRIESIGGTFRIDSRQGGGTRVCISVPIAASKE